MTRETPINICGILYDLIVTYRWILKQTTYDLIYPLILGMIVISIFAVINIYLMLLAVCKALAVLGYFF